MVPFGSSPQSFSSPPAPSSATNTVTSGSLALNWGEAVETPTYSALFNEPANSCPTQGQYGAPAVPTSLDCAIKESEMALERLQQENEEASSQVAVAEQLPEPALKRPRDSSASKSSLFPAAIVNPSTPPHPSQQGGIGSNWNFDRELTQDALQERKFIKAQPDCHHFPQVNADEGWNPEKIDSLSSTWKEEENKPAHLLRIHREVRHNVGTLGPSIERVSTQSGRNLFYVSPLKEVPTPVCAPNGPSQHPHPFPGNAASASPSASTGLVTPYTDSSLFMEPRVIAVDADIEVRRHKERGKTAQTQSGQFLPDPVSGRENCFTRVAIADEDVPRAQAQLAQEFGALQEDYARPVEEQTASIRAAPDMSDEDRYKVQALDRVVQRVFLGQIVSVPLTQKHDREGHLLAPTLSRLYHLAKRDKSPRYQLITEVAKSVDTFLDSYASATRYLSELTLINELRVQREEMKPVTLADEVVYRTIFDKLDLRFKHLPSAERPHVESTTLALEIASQRRLLEKMWRQYHSYLGTEELVAREVQIANQPEGPTGEVVSKYRELPTSVYCHHCLAKCTQGKRSATVPGDHYPLTWRASQLSSGSVSSS